MRRSRSNPTTALLAAIALVIVHAALWWAFGQEATRMEIKLAKAEARQKTMGPIAAAADPDELVIPTSNKPKGQTSDVAGAAGYWRSLEGSFRYGFFLTAFVLALAIKFALPDKTG